MTNINTIITDEQLDSLNEFTTDNEYINNLYVGKVQSTTTKVLRDYKPTTTSIQLLSLYGNKSQAIRALTKEGKTRSEIADLLNIRYQHVRNIQLQITKKS